MNYVTVPAGLLVFAGIIFGFVVGCLVGSAVERGL